MGAVQFVWRGVAAGMPFPTCPSHSRDSSPLRSPLKPQGTGLRAGAPCSVASSFIAPLAVRGCRACWLACVVWLYLLYCSCARWQCAPALSLLSSSFLSLRCGKIAIVRFPKVAPCHQSVHSLPPRELWAGVCLECCALWCVPPIGWAALVFALHCLRRSPSVNMLGNL